MEVQAWLEKLGVDDRQPKLRPWTGLPDRKYMGITPTQRVKAILDAVTIEVLGGARNTRMVLQQRDAASEIERAMWDIVVDLSQNPGRRYFSNAEGVAKCITTASKLYSFRRDRVVLPFELMLLQGHSESLKVPQGMRPKELAELAGEGICLPSLGLIVTSLMLAPGL